MILSSFPVQLEEYWHHTPQKAPHSMKCKHLGSSFPPDSSAIAQTRVNSTHLTQQERDVLQTQMRVFGNVVERVQTQVFSLQNPSHIL